MKTRAELELEMLEVLTKNGFTLEECAYVLKDISSNIPLGEAITRVYYQRNLEKESYEPLPNDVFNDPVAF